jgi:AraC-like DNA-binding protein
LIHLGGWVTKRQAYDFTFDVVERSNCRDAVFSAYLDFEFDHLGPVATAMKACKTVKEALEVGMRVGSRAYEGNEYFLKIDGDTTWFCYREPRVHSAGQTFINDMTLTVYYQLIRAATGKDWRPERMVIRQEKIDRHRTVRNFEDCQAASHPDYSALAFPTRLLSRRSPWHHSDPTPETSKDWIGVPDENEPIANAVYRLAASRLRYGKLPTLDYIASIAGTSIATLKRQLHASGVSYGGLLDRLRFDNACAMLLDPQLSVKEIARALGYSGTNNFVRGFRRMTGTSPGEFRRRREEGLDSVPA